MQPSLLSYLRKLRNHDFAQAYNLICNNLSAGELTEGSVLLQAVEAVQDYAPKLLLLKGLIRQHPISQELDILKKERHQYLLSLRGRVAYYLRSPDKTERANANILHLWLLSYHEFFSGASIQPQSRLCINMCGEIDASEELETIIADLNLSNTVDHIRSITSTMVELHLVRLNQIKEESAKVKLVRETAFKHIQTLWKTLEVSVALKTNDGAVCRALFDSINWVIIDFKARYLGKNTRRENEKLKEEQEGELPETETDPEPETT